MPEVRLELWRRFDRQTTGWVDRERRRIRLYVGYDMGEAEAALLHGLAHFAAWINASGPEEAAYWHYHRRGRAWRRLFQAAVLEVTGVQLRDWPRSCDLDAEAARVLRRQLRGTA